MSRTIIVILILASFCLYAQDDKKPTALPTPVNSEFMEARPYITPDNRKLFFVRRYHPQNINGVKGQQDIWMAQRGANGQWEKPENMGDVINIGKRSNFLVATNDDGSVLILQNPGYKKMKSVLVKATYKGGTWVFEEMPFIGYYNASDYQDFHYSFKHNLIISAIEKSDSKGGQDLHYSLYDREEMAYTTPINMGSIINSDKDDFAPFLSSDERTLFFSSYGHKTKGNADLFVSTRIGDGWENWTEPINLGDPINSRNEETYLSVSADYEYIYFDNYPPGASKRNLMIAKLPREFKPKVIVEEKPVLVAGASEREEPAAHVKEEEEIEVAEEVKVQQPEIAIVDKSQTIVSEKEEIKSEEAASQEQTPPLTRPDAVSIDKEVSPVADNKMKDETLINTIKSESSDKLVTKRRLEGGKFVTKVVHNIYFDFNSSAVRSDYGKYLDLIAEHLLNNTKGSLFIEGHTDAVGGEKINLNLSCLRAFNVKNHLIARGVPDNRIQVECYGDERPLASNDDEVMGREINRRIEMKIMRD